MVLKGTMEDILEKICQCAICLEIFKNPKTLVCQHTFCELCLELACIRNKDGKWDLTCPTCRSKQPFINQKNDISLIGASQIVKEITELLRNKTTGKKKILDETSKENLINKSTKPHIFASPKSIKESVTSHCSTILNDSFLQLEKISCDKTYQSELVNALEKSKDKLAVYAEKCKKQEIDLRRLRNLNMMLLIDNTLLKMKSFEMPMNLETRKRENRKHMFINTI
ncbi:tripartite motif containing 13 [Hydra vulgaris]|uniref:tripartite motif containing 13 n=1 Tax=Hydra vulgaris TaxID=6087 RepID=UPI001F5FBF4B|nr:tripartite motif containing 13-like [Hydra vulgaris]